MKPLTMVVIVVLIVAVGVGTGFRVFNAPVLFDRSEPVTVVHWSNGHMYFGAELPKMAEKFNDAMHKTASGQRIEVQVFYAGSSAQARDLRSRVIRNVRDVRERPDPIIVTPSAAHWLIPVNFDAGRTIVDISGSESIVRTMIGIVTYREMAECLGWPQKEIGYADIIALREDSLGWERYDCAKAEWGRKPLVAYTDPTESSTGRSVLISLYAIAAGKTPEQLTIDDISDPTVVEYVRKFQGLVDHYMINTGVVNAKIYQGLSFGHFFLMPEDNLIQLYEGTAETPEGIEAPPINADMVMIYPKEGTMARNNCACFVQAEWVTQEQNEAAQKWVAFLLLDEQQRKFMEKGFRPARDHLLTDPASKITAEYGLDAMIQVEEYSPQKIDPSVAAAIDDSWEDVKKPGIVTFVIDTSGSMKGEKTQQTKDGLVRALDAMARNNQVGFLSFDDKINSRVPVAPLAQNRFKIAPAVQEVRARGQTALYDAIKVGIEMSDAAVGSPDAIRGVVVLTDGQANNGQTKLHDLIRMMSRDEVPIHQYEGMVGQLWARDEVGRSVSKQDVTGDSLAIETDHPVQIFFIGIGDDADLEVGRMLAEATGAEFQGVTEKDLAAVLEEFSKYF